MVGWLQTRKTLRRFSKILSTLSSQGALDSAVMRGTRHSWNTPIWRNTNERAEGNLNVKREQDKRIPNYRMPINPEEPESYVIPSNVPAFLVKLWKLVEDPQYEMHISWNRVTIRAYYQLYASEWSHR